MEKKFVVMFVSATIDVKCERKAVHGRLALIGTLCAMHITDSIDEFSLPEYSVTR